MRRTVYIILAAVFVFSLCGCLPKGKISGPAEIPSVYEELGEKNGFTYAYKIHYDGDYTKLTEEQQNKLVETELLEISPYKTSTVYKCKGVRKYFFADDCGKCGSCIYFYTSAEKDVYTLYSYNIETGLFQTLVESPASQMVIPEGDYEFGWIAKEATIYAVDLDKGTIDEDKTYNLENSELLFYSGGQEFDRKLTRLYPGESDTLICLNVEYYTKENPDVPANCYTYLFEVTTETFIGPFENMLMN
ncbi:MAG: hypothetical protein IJL87_06915 [Clostridia bacterium]|nr:hypothetical protein [Clostridia bacterium]